MSDANDREDDERMMPAPGSEDEAPSFLERTKALADRLSALGRQLASPWQSGDSLLELRRSVIDCALAEVVPMGGGKRLFPHGTVRIDLHPVNADQSLRLAAALQPDFQTELRQALTSEFERLEAANGEPSIDLVLHDVGPEPSAERVFEISFLQETLAENDSQTAAPWPSRTASESPTAPILPEESGPMRLPKELEDLPPKPPLLSLSLKQGSAERSSYDFAAERIYLGRMRDVFDGHGRLRRRNHVAFHEDGEENSTVSREHAQIRYSHESGDYWLVDDRSAYGTRIFREGRPIDVSSRDRRGIRLIEGDQIYLGKAVLNVSFGGGKQSRSGLAHSA